jgi:long-chain fatty acid transport protein
MKTQCISIQDKECAVDEKGADATADGTTVQNIRRYWNNTVAIRAGASYWLKPTLEIFGGIGFETAAIPDETLDPALSDANTIAPALGARVEVIPTLFIAASYTHIQYFNRDNTGKSQLDQASNPTQRPDGGGRYTQWIGTLNANIQKSF